MCVHVLVLAKRTILFIMVIHFFCGNKKKCQNGKLPRCFFRIIFPVELSIIRRQVCESSAFCKTVHFHPDVLCLRWLGASWTLSFQLKPMLNWSSSITSLEGPCRIDLPPAFYLLWTSQLQANESWCRSSTPEQDIDAGRDIKVFYSILYKSMLSQSTQAKACKVILSLYRYL